MRDLVYAGIEQHFGPMMYRQLSILSWTRRCIAETDPTKRPIPRLLYTFGAMEATLDDLRTAGRPLWLRSKEMEKAAGAKNRALQTCIYELLGGGDESDVVLLRAVTAGREKGHKTVSYAVFDARLEGKANEWEGLRTLLTTFVSNCEKDGALKQLETCADEAYTTLRDGQNHVYDDWYLEGERQVAEAAQRGSETTEATTAAGPSRHYPLSTVH
jgi:hypothetical protein